MYNQRYVVVENMNEKKTENCKTMNNAPALPWFVIE